MSSLFFGILLLILGSILYFYVEELLRPGKHMYLGYKRMIDDPEVSDRGKESAKILMSDFKPVYTAFFFVHFIGLLLILLSGFVAQPFFSSLLK